MHQPLWEAMLDGALVGSGTRFLDAGREDTGPPPQQPAEGSKPTGPER